MKWALIKNGVVVNIIIWSWDGDVNLDIYRDFTKVSVNESEEIGAGYHAEKDNLGNWSYIPSVK